MSFNPARAGETGWDFDLNPSLHVIGDTPPAFIVHAENDPVDIVTNSLVYYIALQKAGVTAEIHLYAKGKHAFGVRHTTERITEWPELAEKWMRTIGVISQ